MKQVNVRILLIFVLLLSFTIWPFQNVNASSLSDLWAEDLRQQEELLSREGGFSSQVGIDGLKQSLESFLAEGNQFAAEVWFSEDPRDLDPIRGTTWMFTFTIYTTTFTDTITFGSKTLYTSDGTVALSATNQYGRPGAVFYWDFPPLGRCFGVVIEGSIITEFYNFTVSGNSASGYYCLKDLYGDYSNLYSLTGTKISGPDVPLSDTTSPDTSIVFGPSGIIDYSNVAFTWTGSDDVTQTSNLLYSYKLEGYDSDWSNYSSATSKTYNGLPNNSYTFKVRAKDAAGNVDTSPASQSFTVNVSFDCGPEQAVPNEQIVKLCDAACQQGAPVKAGSQALDVCMNYSGPVTALVGIMTQDFSAAQWLRDDCSFSDNFQIAMDGSQYLACSNVQFSEAFRQGWVFWLVSPVSLDQLDWQSGDYELLFNQIPEGCPSGEVEIQGKCVSCSDSCTDLFPGNIPAIIQCNTWQDSNCGSPSPPPSQKVAVVVGISDYKDNTSNPNTGEPYIPDLDYADDDARSMRELLHGDGWQVILLTDSSGTKAAIRDQINNNISDASKFLFFFAGHGTAEGSIGYIEPYDSLHNAYSNSISEDELESWLLSGGSNAEIGVILDGCHSGSFIGREISRGEKAKRIYNRFATKANVDFVDPRAGEFFARDLARNGWVVLTASKGSEISWESSGISHGYLTYYLLSALKNINNDNNSNGSISIEEAYDEIRGLGNIGDLQYPQHPQLYDGNGYDVDFDVLQIGN